MATDFVEPFGLIFDSKSDGSGNLNPGYVRIPEGIHTIMITWDGNTRLRVFRSHDQAASTRIELGQIPDGTGRRSMVITGLGVKAGENAFLSVTTTSVEAAGRRATVQVTTMPLQA